MTDIVLRSYQQQSIDLLRDGIRKGNRTQLLSAPTGSGKSVCAAYLMAEAYRKKSKVAFVVDRIALVDQFSAVLDSYEIPHGVIQAGHWRRRLYEPLQVCSAQTLEKRQFFPNLDLLVCDEGHIIRKQTAEFITNQTSVKVLGLTATPFTKGLGNLYSNLVNVTTTNKLIDEGFLVPLKTYVAKAIDMTGAKIVAGEWSDKDIETRGKVIVGDIVSEWIDKTQIHFGGPRKTIVFSATVDHGLELCRQFAAAGYRFEQISYKDTNDTRRRELIEEFRKPDSAVIGLVSCEVLSRGFDVPDVFVGITSRPYRKSLSSVIQQLGRLMRPFPGKDFALLLDHSNNSLRFRSDIEDFFHNGVSHLDDGEHDAKVRKEPTKEEKDTYACTCGYLLPPKSERCPACGREIRRRSLVESVPGVMVALDGFKLEPNYLHDRKSVWRQLVGFSIQRKRGDAEAARRFAQAQYKNLFGDFCNMKFEDTTPEPIGPALHAKVISNVIRWAKSQHRRAA